MAYALKPCTTWGTYADKQYSSLSSYCKVNIFVPANGVDKAPCVVYLHGGAWESGDKTQDVTHLATLVKMGFVVAIPNYRLSQQAIWPAQLIDCKSVIRWLRANAATYHIWPDKIGVWGMSAGGHLAAMLAQTNGVAKFEAGDNLAYSSSVTVALDDCGPVDLEEWVHNSDDPNVAACVTQLLGGSVDDLPDLAADASPVTWACAASAPMTIRHGDADRVVPVEQSQELHDIRDVFGIPANKNGLAVYEGYGHVDPRMITESMVRAIGGGFAGWLQP